MDYSYDQYDQYDAPEEPTGINSMLLILIGLAAVVVLGAITVGVLVGLSMLGRGAESPAPNQPSFDVPTAREAYLPAVDLIRQSDPGAQLASGAGAWTPGVDPVYLQSGRTGWTFSFYLPASQEMAEVVVNRGGSAAIVEVQDWETPPMLLDDQGWQIDSPQALGMFLSVCQEEVNAAPDITVQTRLSASAQFNNLIWQMVATNDAGERVCVVSVDASTGQYR